MKDWQINYRYYVDQKHAVDRIESEVLDALRDVDFIIYKSQTIVQFDTGETMVLWTTQINQVHGIIDEQLDAKPVPDVPVDTWPDKIDGTVPPFACCAFCDNWEFSVVPLTSEGGYTEVRCQAGQYSLGLCGTDPIYTRDVQALLIKYVNCPKYVPLSVKKFNN